MTWLINWLAGWIYSAVQTALQILMPFFYWAFAGILKYVEFWVNIIVDGFLYLWLIVLYLLDAFLIAFVALINYTVGSSGVLQLSQYESSILNNLVLVNGQQNIFYEATYTLRLPILLQCLNIYLIFLITWTLYRFVARWIRG